MFLESIIKDMITAKLNTEARKVSTILSEEREGVPGEAFHVDPKDPDYKKDLLTNLVNELEYYDTNGSKKALINKTNKIIEEENWETGIEDKLVEALNDYAPAYFYFSSYQDGWYESYGFLPDQDMDATFDGLSVSDTDEIPDDYVGEVMVTNDHGNQTLYFADKGKLEEIWDIV